MVVVGVAGKGELWWWVHWVWPLVSLVVRQPWPEFVVRCAGEGQVVDVGWSALGPVVDVVDFAEVAGHIAARVCAASVFGVQDDSLVG